MKPLVATTGRYDTSHAILFQIPPISRAGSQKNSLYAGHCGFAASQQCLVARRLIDFPCIFMV
jgi:hypothetical protein